MLRNGLGARSARAAPPRARGLDRRRVHLPDGDHHLHGWIQRVAGHRQGGRGAPVHHGAHRARGGRSRVRAGEHDDHARRGRHRRRLPEESHAEGHRRRLRGHIVVAGCGSTGRYVVEELRATRREFVVVDRSEQRLREISEEICDGEMRFVVGDATHDHAPADGRSGAGERRGGRAHRRRRQPLRDALGASAQRHRAHREQGGGERGRGQDAARRRERGGQPQHHRRQAHGLRAGAPAGRRVPRPDAPHTIIRCASRTCRSPSDSKLVGKRACATPRSARAPRRW